MDKSTNLILATISAVGGTIIYWLGGLDNLLMALMAAIVIDYITGLCKAAATKTLSSAVGFRGIVRKVLILSLVALAFILDQLTRGALPLREIVIMFFIANEGLSILENATEAGLPIPDKLRAALAQIRGGEAAEDA